MVNSAMIVSASFTRRAIMAAAAGVTLCPSLIRASSPSADGAIEPLQKIINDQMGSGSPIVVPPGAQPVYITGPIYVPAGVTLVIQRDLVGVRSAMLLLEGRTSLHFEDAHVTDVQLKLLNGTITITGLDYSGHAYTSAVLIEGPGPYANLRISDFRITDANYGVLRQGHDSILSGATIAKGTFRNLAGDPIEWNVCPHDIGVVIEDHDIQGPATPTDKPFWGIGIGVAGAHYSPTWDPAVSARDFIIRRIRARALSQLIHVEIGVSFTIEDIEGYDIASRHNERSGLDTGSVVCYGCRDFLVRDINADGRIMLGAGAVRGRYIVPCSDFDLENVHLTRGDIRLDVGGLRSYAHLRHIQLDAGSLHIAGAARRLELTDVDIVSSNSKTEPLVFNPGFLTGALAAFSPRNGIVSRNNVHLRRGNPIS